MRNTRKLQRTRAWQAGYTAGRAGNALASPPYLDAAITMSLIRDWREGHRAGLDAFRNETNAHAADEHAHP